MTGTQVQTREQMTMDSVPTLTTEILKSAQDKQAAIKLVADSIAQQRQVASYYLITRPQHLAVLFAFYATIYAYNSDDFTPVVITASGITLTYLLIIRYVTGEYIRLAEAFRWRDFINGPNDEEDVVIATRYGEEIIGALVLRLNSAKTKALIRAWTVRVRYRGKGIGGDLLQEAVGIARDRCGRNCDVKFAEDHANSSQPIHAMLGRPFEKRDRNAVKALSAALEA